MTKLYLDVCALSRPFDNLDDLHIRLESDAIIDLLTRITAGQYQLCASDILAYESSQIPSFEVREFIDEIIRHAASSHIALTPAQIASAGEFEKRGVYAYDALHLAAAAAGRCDYYLTTVHKLLRGSQTWSAGLTILNPLDFYIQEFLQRRRHATRRNHP
jgi:hypothetical protein